MENQYIYLICVRELREDLVCRIPDTYIIGFFTFQYSLSVKCEMFRKIKLNCFNYNSGFKFFFFQFSPCHFKQLLFWTIMDLQWRRYFELSWKGFYFCIVKRLTTFAVKVNLIRENHGGFRENYSTIDNMFLLYSLWTFFT